MKLNNLQMFSWCFLPSFLFILPPHMQNRWQARFIFRCHGYIITRAANAASKQRRFENSEIHCASLPRANQSKLSQQRSAPKHFSMGDRAEPNVRFIFFRRPSLFTVWEVWPGLVSVVFIGLNLSLFNLVRTFLSFAAEVRFSGVENEWYGLEQAQGGRVEGRITTAWVGHQRSEAGAHREIEGSHREGDRAGTTWALL